MAKLIPTSWTNPCNEYRKCYAQLKTDLISKIKGYESVKVGITHDLEARAASSDYDDYDSFEGRFRSSSKREWVIQMEIDLIEEFIDLLDNETSGGGGSMPDDADYYYVYFVFKH